MTTQGADNRIIEIPGAYQPGRIFRTLLLGCTLAAILGSSPLLIWAQSLPESPLQPALQAWQAAMSRIGIATLHELVRAVIRALEAKQF